MYTEDEITFPHGETRRLDEVPGWAEFQERTKDFEPKSYLFMASKFSHKVYAQLDSFKSDHRYVVWLDGDLVFHAEFGPRKLSRLLEGRFCAFMGRTNVYSETGCIIFDTEHPDFLSFAERYAAMYDNGEIFGEFHWTDCHAFDAARVGLEASNITPKASGFGDILGSSPLAEYMVHNKGGLKGEGGNAAV